MDAHDETAVLFRALAHPVRLQIIEVLARDGEACVCHLECRLGQRQPQVSQQLMRLKEAGLVKGRREGLNIFYSLADPGIVPLLQASHKTAAGIARPQGRRRAERLQASAAPRACPCPRCKVAAEPAMPRLKQRKADGYR